MLKKLMTLACVLALSAACGDDEDTKVGNNATTNNATTNNATTNNATTNNATTNSGTGDSLTAITYNTGLAIGFVSLAEERRAPVAEAIANLDADYVCLQEVWLTQDMEGGWTEDNIDAILAEAGEAFPHNYYAITNTQGTAGAACTEEEAAPLEACVLDNCDGVPPGELAGCVTGSCGDEFGAVSGECQGCLVGQLGAPFEDIREACIGGEGGNSYFSDGHNGLLLLSKHPLTDTSETTMPAVQVSRSILKATSEHPTMGTVDILCTHLTAAIGGVTYPADTSDFASYEEEQANQISVLTDMADQATNPVLVMGDMNTGPAINGLDAELPDNWTALSGSGLYAPYVDSESPECTYCSTNTLVDSTDDVLIDHVFTSWEPLVISAERILDETQSIADAENNLSDHYGVRVEVGRME